MGNSLCGFRFYASLLRSHHKHHGSFKKETKTTALLWSELDEICFFDDIHIQEMRKSFCFGCKTKMTLKEHSQLLLSLVLYIPCLFSLFLITIQLLNNQQSLCPPAANLWARTNHKQRGPIPVPGAAPSCLPGVWLFDRTVKNKPASSQAPWIMVHAHNSLGLLQWLWVTRSLEAGAFPIPPETLGLCCELTIQSVLNSEGLTNSQSLGQQVFSVMPVCSEKYKGAAEWYLYTFHTF